MIDKVNRRRFIGQASWLLAGTQAGLLLRVAKAADADTVVAETASGKVRGTVVEDVRIFKGIPYGGNTAAKNRFMPPTKPASWTGVRDAFSYGPSAPQITATGKPPAGSTEMSEDCLVLNVWSRGLTGKRPVMVWLHGGGFSTGSGSGPIIEGANLARTGDVVVVSINHRLNVFGQTFLGEQAGPDFALSGDVGMLDTIAALEWVRENIGRFGGDPNLVTIFGQSGGGRKVATLMAMPGAKGLYHRAAFDDGAVLRMTTPEDAIHYTELLLGEVGLKANQARELQNVPVDRLLAADAAVQKKIKLREPGMTPDSPMVDGKALPSHPWDPAAPSLSANIPLMMGWAHTEETLYDRPTPEKLALTEDGLKERTAKRLGVDPEPVIAAFRKAYPAATPWDLFILIATDHPRGANSRELARRKAVQAGAPVYLYRFDWETPEGGGHMRSPHTVEIQFAFNNIKVGGPLISKMPTAYALAEKVSAAWVAFARTGNPNTPKLPKWPAYGKLRDTMLFNDESRVEQDPDREARLAMEHVLKLS